MSNKTEERIEKIEWLVNSYLESEDLFGKTDLAYDIIQNHIGWLVSVAKGAQVLERENSWAYGRLNMISDIIECGRIKSKKIDDHSDN